jgi:hypothetical protein
VAVTAVIAAGALIAGFVRRADGGHPGGSRRLSFDDVSVST